MKNLIILLVLLFTFQLAQCQETETLTEQSKQEMYDFYISKSKNQKKTGWILLGSGIVATGAGILIANNSNVLGDDGGFVSGSLLIVAGTLTTISSIPIFIISGSNNRKAKAILASGEVGIGAIPFNNTRYASVGLKINF